ncbi:hypothetical protein OA93_18600 [Flavobacterium sp. KMS]|uniref:hypothetical protein n=1 Tax=Flavobacterium sp. KMS TaxID=1566023 RepID=UPI00057DAC82|nr:hypothetical protein [Flavobacterium sp. KMS]KIA95301.1 hypothetical protein OA93_18600 [Flavobacterium sp. KMS]
MKSKLSIVGLVLILGLTYSCSNDDVYEVSEVKSNSSQIVPDASLKTQVNEKRKDSINVFFYIKENPSEGDPSNPKPSKR